jgi:hypothetical protein
VWQGVAGRRRSSSLRLASPNTVAP